MSTKNVFMMGVLSMMVASGVVKASDSFASEAQGVDVIERIGAGGSTYSSSRPMPAQPGDSVVGTERRKVDVIERIGAGGSTYSTRQPTLAGAGDEATNSYSQSTPLMRRGNWTEEGRTMPLLSPHSGGVVRRSHGGIQGG